MAVDSDPARMTIPLGPPPVRPAATGPSGAESKVWQDGDTTSFRDILAILNPLQHIPIVGTIYREITGDQIGFMPRVIGSALFGGPVGLALGLVNGLLKSETGKDAGESVASLFGPGSPPDDVPANAPANAPGDAPAPTPAPTPAGPATELLARAAAADPTIPQISEDALARLMARSAPAAPGTPTPGAPGTLPQLGGISLAFHGDNPRFRSTSLPQPVAEGGGLATHTAADLVPTPDGAAIARDQVPNAMMRALEKYGEMMRSRNAVQAASAQMAAAQTGSVQTGGLAAAGSVNVLR